MCLKCRQVQWFDDRNPLGFGKDEPKLNDSGAVTELGGELPPDPGMCLVKNVINGQEVLVRECTRVDFCSLCGIARSKMRYYLRGGSTQANKIHRSTPLAQ